MKLDEQIIKDLVDTLSRISPLIDELADRLTRFGLQAEPSKKEEEHARLPTNGAPTFDMVRAATLAATQLNREWVVTVLADLGAKRASDLTEAQWAEYLRRLEVGE